MSEIQQPGDIADHISMLVSAVESASHDLAGASERASVRECEALLKAEIDAAETRAYAEGRKDEHEDCNTDALRFRWLCEHPDWHFIEQLCRQFASDSSMEFLTELRRVIDARRSVELAPIEEHAQTRSGLIAEVLWSDPLSLYGRIKWLGEPAPLGALLFGETHDRV